MALYLGGNKSKIISGNGVYSLNLFFATPIANSIKLLSAEGYILKDSNGLYLTAKEGE